MADFEGLIRQALARQDDKDPAVRERIYKSSRNAFARMVAAGNQSPATVETQRRSLENSIARIEAGYNPRPAAAARETARPAPPPERPAPGPARQPAPPPPPPVAAAPEAAPRIREVAPPRAPEPAPARAGRQSPPPREEPMNDPVLDFDDPGLTENGAFEDDYETRSPSYPQPPRRHLARLLGFLAILLVLLLLGWLGYRYVAPMLADPAELVGQGRPAASDPAEAAASADAAYITILAPGDTSGFRVEGRGRAELVNQGGTDLLRIVSVRPETNRDNPAEPMLIEIGEGALAEIAGRRVTVEIQAKSGAPGPATFAVGCDFAGEDACGRKRFRVGLQPEAIVFTIEMPEQIPAGEQAFLTLSTDVTSTANVAGEGDPVDIAYARLRYQKR